MIPMFVGIKNMLNLEVWKIFVHIVHDNRRNGWIDENGRVLRRSQDDVRVIIFKKRQGNNS